MKTELTNLKKNKTWVLVDKPKGVKAIDLKWVFKQKSDTTFRARLVAKGFQQSEINDNLYSPVSRIQTLKVLLVYCCKNNLFIEQMDVETTFLNGKIKGNVYVKQPPGFIRRSNKKVFKLFRSLYGLKESPRQWYDCIHDFLNFQEKKK